MATNSKLNLTRDQLASFLQDHEKIKQFERLFASVNELVPTTIADLVINTGNADQKAVQALDALKRIADALELLATAPAAQQSIAQDDLTPPEQPFAAIDDLTPPAAIFSVHDDLTPPAERHNSIDYVDFNPLGPVPADKTGRVYWSDDDATLDVMLEGGVTGQVCQQLDFHPKNTSGVQINKGQAVMATGVVGASTKITCAKAVVNGTVPPQYMLGIAAQDIPANSFGYVVWFGSVRGFNTTGANKTVPETWVDGDVLYFDPAYPGELTKVEPVAPNLDLPIAIVTNAANNGAIFVRMKTGETLEELHDVHVPTPTNNDLLVYDSTDVRWENKNVTTTFNLPALSANGVLYLNASKVATAGTSLTFNGTTFAANAIGSFNSLLIGTSSSGGAKLTVQDSFIQVRTDGDILRVNNVADTTYFFRLTRSGNNFEISNRQAGELVFLTSDVARARINSGGDFLIGTATQLGSSRLTVENTDRGIGVRITGTSKQTIFGVYIAKPDNDSTTSQRFIGFTIDNDNTGSGQINANGAGAAAFGTFSDERLKTNIVDLAPQLEKVLSLRPVEFDYKDGSGHQTGFVAQEMQHVYPDAVGEQDGFLTVTGYGKTEARLIKAIQEQQTIINGLRSRVDAIEAKI